MVDAIELDKSRNGVCSNYMAMPTHIIYHSGLRVGLMSSPSVYSPHQKTHAVIWSVILTKVEVGMLLRNVSLFMSSPAN